MDSRLYGNDIGENLCALCDQFFFVPEPVRRSFSEGGCLCGKKSAKFSNIFKRFTQLFEYFRTFYTSFQTFLNVFNRFRLTCFTQTPQFNLPNPIFTSKTNIPPKITPKFFPKNPVFKILGFSKTLNTAH